MQAAPVWQSGARIACIVMQLGCWAAHRCTHLLHSLCRPCLCLCCTQVRGLHSSRLLRRSLLQLVTLLLEALGGCRRLLRLHALQLQLKSAWGGGKTGRQCSGQRADAAVATSLPAHAWKKKTHLCLQLIDAAEQHNGAPGAVTCRLLCCQPLAGR